MRCLLDTHAFLWWVDDSPRLSKRARATMKKGDCSVSLVSAWEMAVKASLGKLRLALPVGLFFERHAVSNGFEVLAIELMHISAIEAMPHHHGDPFDRLLVAQANANHLAIISADEHLSEYGVTRIW